MKKSKSSIIILMGLTLFFSCEKKPGTIKGYEPVYDDIDNLLAVHYEPQGKAVQNGGKIYLLGDTLYQVETDQGLHIINVSDKSNPQSKGFISIRGCREVAANGNIIFTNNFTELLALRLSASGVAVVKRLPESFVTDNVQALPPERGYFKCPVAIPGKQITDWRKTELVDPKCFY